MIDWQLVAKLAYDLALVAVSITAIGLGGFDERVGVAIIVVASGLTDVALPVGMLTGIHSRHIVAGVNVACLLGLDALMVRSRRFWPMWATGAQLASLSFDAAMLLMPVAAGPYVVLRGKFAYAVLLALLIGTLSRRKRAPARLVNEEEVPHGG